MFRFKLMFLTATVVAGFAFCPHSRAQIASTFDNDLEGWMLEGASASDFTHNSSGGNLAGVLRLFGSAPTTIELVAPTMFLGDLNFYNGGTFSFDGEDAESADSTLTSFGTITISGPAGTASRDIVPGRVSFSIVETYSTPMTASEWGVSQTTWDAILSNVTRLSIDVSAQSSLVDILIDNIRIDAIPGRSPLVPGDVNLSGLTTFDDIPPLIFVMQSGVYQSEGDVNRDGFVNFSDIPPFVLLLVGQ